MKKINSFSDKENIYNLDTKETIQGKWLWQKQQPNDLFTFKFTGLVSELKTNFNIIQITESLLTAKRKPVSSTDITGYHIEHRPTNPGKGGSLYISKELSTTIKLPSSVSLMSAVKNNFLLINHFAFCH